MSENKSRYYICFPHCFLTSQLSLVLLQYGKVSQVWSRNKWNKELHPTAEKNNYLKIYFTIPSCKEDQKPKANIKNWLISSGGEYYYFSNTGEEGKNSEFFSSPLPFFFIFPFLFFSWSSFFFLFQVRIGLFYFSLLCCHLEGSRAKSSCQNTGG